MKKILFCLFLCSIASSCTSTKYVSFTTDLRKSLEQEGVDFKNIQFYASSKIVLQRDIEDKKNEINQGEISRSKTTIREKVNIGTSSEGAAGLCKIIEPNGIGICFENGDPEQKKIMFGETNDWGGRYMIKSDNPIIYDNHPYKVVEGRSAFLKISLEDKNKFIGKSRDVKGLYVK